MESKKCITCGIEKSISEFYKHIGMSDGLLNKCKDCVKKYSKTLYLNKKVNKEWYDSELNRQRIKNKSNKNRVDIYFEKYPEKYKALISSQRIKPPQKGLEKHHWSYNEEHYKDVIWLNVKDHATAHRF